MARALSLLVLVVVAACQQRAEGPAWPETTRSWQLAQTHLEDEARPALATLDEQAKTGDVESGELANALRGALAELGKTRATAESEVAQARSKPEAMTELMTKALQKAERRLEQAKHRAEPPGPEPKNAPEPVSE